MHLAKFWCLVFLPVCCAIRLKGWSKERPQWQKAVEEEKEESKAVRGHREKTQLHEGSGGRSQDGLRHSQDNPTTEAKPWWNRASVGPMSSARITGPKKMEVANTVAAVPLPEAAPVEAAPMEAANESVVKESVVEEQPPIQRFNTFNTMRAEDMRTSEAVASPRKEKDGAASVPVPAEQASPPLVPVFLNGVPSAEQLRAQRDQASQFRSSATYYERGAQQVPGFAVTRSDSQDFPGAVSRSASQDFPGLVSRSASQAQLQPFHVDWQSALQPVGWDQAMRSGDARIVYQWIQYWRSLFQMPGVDSGIQLKLQAHIDEAERYYAHLQQAQYDEQVQEQVYLQAQAQARQEQQRTQAAQAQPPPHATLRPQQAQAPLPPNATRAGGRSSSSTQAQRQQAQPPFAPPGRGSASSKQAPSRPYETLTQLPQPGAGGVSSSSTQVTVGDNPINLRKRKESDSFTGVTVQQHEVVTLLAEEGDWVNVRCTTGNEGWMRKRYLSSTKAEFAEDEPVVAWSNSLQCWREGTLRSFTEADRTQYPSADPKEHASLYFKEGTIWKPVLRRDIRRDTYKAIVQVYIDGQWIKGLMNAVDDRTWRVNYPSGGFMLFTREQVTYQVREALEWNVFVKMGLNVDPTSMRGKIQKLGGTEFRQLCAGVFFARGTDAIPQNIELARSAREYALKELAYSKFEAVVVDGEKGVIKEFTKEDDIVVQLLGKTVTIPRKDVSAKLLKAYIKFEAVVVDGEEEKGVIKDFTGKGEIIVQLPGKTVTIPQEKVHKAEGMLPECAPVYNALLARDIPIADADWGSNPKSLVDLGQLTDLMYALQQNGQVFYSGGENEKLLWVGHLAAANGSRDATKIPALVEKSFNGQPPNVMFLGDTHGRFGSGRMAFRHWISQEMPYLVILGDMVDRGNRQLDVAVAFMALRCMFPTRVMVLRGNHEVRSENERYGFACVNHQNNPYHPLQPFRSLNTIFNAIPFALTIRQPDAFRFASGAAMHGGFGPETQALLPLGTATTQNVDMTPLIEIRWFELVDNRSQSFPENPRRSIPRIHTQHGYNIDDIRNFLQSLNVCNLFTAHSHANEVTEVTEGEAGWPHLQNACSGKSKRAVTLTGHRFFTEAGRPVFCSKEKTANNPQCQGKFTMMRIRKKDVSIEQENLFSVSEGDGRPKQDEVYKALDIGVGSQDYPKLRQGCPHHKKWFLDDTRDTEPAL